MRLRPLPPGSRRRSMLLFFRCLVFVGVCVEFVAAVAWLAELFPDPKQRERVLGFTQAFSSVGGLLVAIASGLAAGWANELPEIHLPGFLSCLGVIKVPHAPWRYTLMSGLIPAIPLIMIRPFLPESPVWQKKHDSGTLRRPSFAELFSPSFGAQLGSHAYVHLSFAPPLRDPADPPDRAWSARGASAAAD